MSKSASKKEANLKASVEELIEPLLKRISGGKCGPKNHESIERLSRLVKGTKDLIEESRKSKCELITYFGKMEREIDLWEECDCEEINNNKREDTWGVLMDNLEALLQKHRVHDHGSHEGLERDNSPPQIGTKFELGESSNNNKYQENDWNDIDPFREWMTRMGDRNIRLVFFLAIFPEGAVLKKGQLINWWVDLDLFYYEYLDMDNLFDSLIDEGILVSVHAKKHNQVTDMWTINPTFHRLLNRVHYFKIKPYRNEYSAMLIHLFGWQLTAVLNRDQQYLYSLDLKEFLENDNNADINYGDSVKVVQLGKWGGTGTDLKSQDHIEVDDTHFLNYLAKSTRYLGLQGISRIEKLPKSIGKLPNLKILDLRACHNLDKLPEKPHSKRGQVTWFPNLVYLDISECYLLDHMPKWIRELYRLEVLKGFVAGSVSKKEQSCQLHDLVELRNLTKLSIRIAKHLNPVDASALESMMLSILTVTWGIKHNNENERDKVQTISFPTTLEKLDLRCYPEAEATELNPVALPELKRLYIRGGKLTKIETGFPWEALEVLRLRFLNDLEMDWYELPAKFTRLEHVEYEQCCRLKHFPKIGLLGT